MACHLKLPYTFDSKWSAYMNGIFQCWQWLQFQASFFVEKIAFIQAFFFSFVIKNHVSFLSVRCKGFFIFIRLWIIKFLSFSWLLDHIWCIDYGIFIFLLVNIYKFICYKNEIIRNTVLSLNATITSDMNVSIWKFHILNIYRLRNALCFRMKSKWSGFMLQRTINSTSPVI